MSPSQLALKWWGVLCPVKLSEAKKFIPMTLMMFFVLFNFSMLRSLKDSLVVSNMGAEVISFVKLWCVLPSAILFTFVYMKLSNIFDSEKLLYVIVSFFAGFFALFAFALYPYQEFFHPDPENIKRWVVMLPNLKWFITLAGKWSFALFYIFAELWGVAVLSVSFWQFANRVTKTEEAKRFYSMFGLVGNIGLICSGTAVQSFATSASNSGEGSDLIIFSMGALIASCIVIMGIYRWMHLNVVNDPRYCPQIVAKSGKKKLSLSIIDSLKLIVRSKHIGYIAILVLCYGASINLVEGPWKAAVRKAYSTQNDYAYFMGTYMKWTGAVVIIFMILGTNIIKRVSWFVAAIATPLLIGVTGLLFFLLCIFEKELSPFIEGHFEFERFGFTIGSIDLTFGPMVLVLSPVIVAVFLGAIQNVLSKATKYTLFDSTKEMAFIPIDEELKVKGKAAIDSTGSRLAKSGGAILQSTLLILLPGASFSDPGFLLILMSVFLVLIGCWLVAVAGLNKSYLECVKE